MPDAAPRAKPVSLPASIWPNLVTILRIALIPLLLLAAEAANRGAEEGSGEGSGAGAWRWACVGLLVAIGVTDVLDGRLARRFGWTSELGALLDALADKLVQLTLVGYLALRLGPAFPPVPLWVLGMVVLRDSVLLVGFLLIRRRRGRVDVAHEPHGKLASFLLFLALLWTLLGRAGTPASLLFAGAAVLIVLSTAAYVRHGFAQARAAPS